MASYAALLSLKTIIDTLQNHPNPPISIDSLQVEALLEKVNFLQEFLEAYSHREAYPIDDLESLIRDAAYAAEDVIESYIVDRIGGSTSDRGESFYQALRRVIEDQMDYVKKEAMEIEEKMRSDDAGHQHMSSMSENASLVPPSLGQKTIAVGFEDVLIELLDKLTGQQSSRQIIPIVGMGGIGKTTLAINAYHHGRVVEHFDIRAWVTISQTFSTREILVEVLCQSSCDRKESLSLLSNELLGERVHQNCFGRRYLIAMDDMWSTEAWDEIKRFFPNENNGSRIIITTRISGVAALTNSSVIQMNLLDEDASWSLFCKCLFGEDACPLDFVEIGKAITKSCKGLPLSINVVGGILAKSKRTVQQWEYIAKNLSSMVNLEDNERCLQILHMSYKSLPIYLKSCFLYMGVFQEDAVIRVSKLVKLLVAEGFLKPINDKSLEVVAKEYVKELVDRNLLMVHTWGSIGGNIKLCKIHDLWRDLCLRIAKKEKFLYVLGEYNFDRPENRNAYCRVSVPSTSIEKLDIVTEPTSGARSWICQSHQEFLPSHNNRLLRTLKTSQRYNHREGFHSSITALFLFLNLRFIAIALPNDLKSVNLSPTSHFWNLQTLILTNPFRSDMLPIEIWKMSQLRHIYCTFIRLPDPHDDDFILRNLQTLVGIEEFKCSEEVIQKIPNIKKLRIEYNGGLSDEAYSNYCLNNLERLHKLESLHCGFHTLGKDGMGRTDLLQSLTFPYSLKKLTLSGPILYWEDVNTIVSSTPCLEKLVVGNIKGLKWTTTQVQFLRLKVLEIFSCPDLEYWMADGTQFPVLERLRLLGLHNLKEIPSDIGDIPTLQSIMVFFCSDSAADSAEIIQEEQKELGDSGFVVKIERLPKIEGNAPRSRQ